MTNLRSENGSNRHKNGPNKPIFIVFIILYHFYRLFGYKMINFLCYTVLCIILPTFSVSFLSSIGGNTLYRRTNTINLSKKLINCPFPIWFDIIAGACPWPAILNFGFHYSSIRAETYNYMISNGWVHWE